MHIYIYTYICVHICICTHAATHFNALQHTLTAGDSDYAKGSALTRTRTGTHFVRESAKGVGFGE